MERNSRVSYLIVVILLIAMSIICLFNMKLERENNKLKNQVERIEKVNIRKGK